MDVLGRWAQLMELPEESLPLDEAALIISASARPSLDVGAQLGRLDGIAADIARVAGGDRPDSRAVCRALFDEMGLAGDREGYDNPENSYLDRVLDRRLGIPISLSVILIEVARRCGVRLEAVGMPGHFLVRDPAQPEFLIDAFSGGRRLDRAACEQLLRGVTAGTAALTPGMLAATGKWATLARMLANLDRSFDDRGDRDGLRRVSQLRAAVPRAPLADRTQLAGRLAALGRFDMAASVLERAASGMEVARVRERLVGDARTLRARLN